MRFCSQKSSRDDYLTTIRNYPNDRHMKDCLGVEHLLVLLLKFCMLHRTWFGKDDHDLIAVLTCLFVFLVNELNLSKMTQKLATEIRVLNTPPSTNSRNWTSIRKPSHQKIIFLLKTTLSSSSSRSGPSRNAVAGPWKPCWTMMKEFTGRFGWLGWIWKMQADGKGYKMTVIFYWWLYKLTKLSLSKGFFRESEMV